MENVGATTPPTRQAQPLATLNSEGIARQITRGYRRISESGTGTTPAKSGAAL